MGSRFAALAFTPKVKAAQERNGSRKAMARMEAAPDAGDALGPDEAEFIAARDFFFMATVGETGWPYLQHRGGPAGFLHVLGPRTLAFADFRGNRQYVSVGNLAGDGRAALFLLDQAQQQRLKILARVELRDPAADPALLAQVADAKYPARIERIFVLHVEAFDWNCAQHITPRYTAAEVEDAVRPLRERIAELERQVTKKNQQ